MFKKCALDETYICSYQLVSLVQYVTIDHRWWLTIMYWIDDIDWWNTLICIWSVGWICIEVFICMCYIGYMRLSFFHWFDMIDDWMVDVYDQYDMCKYEILMKRSQPSRGVFVSNRFVFIFISSGMLCMLYQLMKCA